MEKWTTHVYGASALLELRGPSELQTAEGLKLFIQLRFQIVSTAILREFLTDQRKILGCLQRGLHVPQSLLECNKLSMYLRPQMEAYCDGVISITGRLSNLRADIFSGKLADADEIISRAYSLEADLISWAAATPPEFLYTAIVTPSPFNQFRASGWGPHLYSGEYHLYHDLWICHTWNQYRCARIFTCEIIISCIRYLCSSSPGALSIEIQSQLAALRKTSRDLAADICASAPYHFGADGLSGNGQRIFSSQANVGGMLLLLPLALAAATERRGHSIRRWVTDCLTLIGCEMGIDLSFAIIEMLHIEAGFFEDIEETELGLTFLETDKTRQNRTLVGTWSSMVNRNSS